MRSVWLVDTLCNDSPKTNVSVWLISRRHPLLSSQLLFTITIIFSSGFSFQHMLSVRLPSIRLSFNICKSYQAFNFFLIQKQKTAENLDLNHQLKCNINKMIIIMK